MSLAPELSDASAHVVSRETTGASPPPQVTAGLHTQSGQSARAAQTMVAVLRDCKDSARKAKIDCIDLCTLSHKADGVASVCADKSVRPLTRFAYANCC